MPPTRPPPDVASSRSDSRECSRPTSLLSLDLTDQIDQGSERDRVPADVHTATEIQVCARESCRLVEQRGLANAWVTADQHDPWLTLGGSRHGALKHRQLVVASDDRVVTVTDSHRFRQYSPPAQPFGAPRGIREARPMRSLLTPSQCDVY